MICSQSKFHNALAIASCAAPTKPSHPVLANVLIAADAKAQQVHLTVTDLTMTVQLLALALSDASEMQQDSVQI